MMICPILNDGAEGQGEPDHTLARCRGGGDIVSNRQGDRSARRVYRRSELPAETTMIDTKPAAQGI
jgi:hypothetical protein